MQSVESVNIAVLDLIKAGQAQEARRVLDEGLERWPKSARLKLSKGEVLASAGGRDDAALHYAGLMDDPAIAPWAAGRLFALLEGEPVALETAAALVPAVSAAPEESKKAAMFDRLLAGRDAGDKRRLLEMIAPVSGIFRFEWRRAVDLVEQGEMDAAAVVLEEARRNGRTSAQALLLLAELFTVQGRLAEAVELIEGALPEFGSTADFCRRAVSLLQRAGAIDRARELMERALERWPRDWLLLLRLNRLPIEPDRLRRISADLEAKVAPGAEQDDRFRWQYAMVRLNAGDVRGGMELLRKPFEPPTSEMTDPLSKAVFSRTAEQWLAGSRFRDDRSKDVQVVRAPNARATVVLTTGITFCYLPLELVDRLFAEQGLNVIYLRDFNKRVYLRGVASLGASEAETIEALKAMVADLGAPRTIALGSSLGGFSAMRIGALMEADTAVSFAGPTDLAAVFREAKPAIWNPNYFVRAIHDREDGLPRDVIPTIRESRRTRFLQMYGADSAVDEPHARRLEGLDRVEVRSVPGVSDHFLVDHMIGDGSFDVLLDRLASGGT